MSKSRWSAFEDSAEELRAELRRRQEKHKQGPNQYTKGFVTRYTNRVREMDDAIDALRRVTDHPENSMNAQGRHWWPRCEDCLSDLTVYEIAEANPALICSADRDERAAVPPKDVRYFKMLELMNTQPELFGLDKLVHQPPPAQPDPEIVEKAQKYDELVALGLLEQLGITE